ncbi:MAG: hypothetical protein JNK30_02640 [Phenylobacterium sp.]|uniref:hypothetical protein n=1 Tax=Phenylobacterium sp. TaxID=1871053 RepID=UPI001A596AE5|nr:hypothetical protein [Phenylobacterium sp.]MBL8770255.1 hypothetical protein [Phenylobacterium sp.]
MRTLLGAAVAAWAMAGPVLAADDDIRAANRADVRCVIGMSVMARNEAYKQWGMFGVFFYSGRIEGRDPGFSLRDAVRREVMLMRPDEYNEEIKRCSDLLGERSRAFEAMRPSPPRGTGR